MKLTDLVRTIPDMSDDELREHIRDIRHRREVIRPAAKARVERAEKKIVRGTNTSAAKAVAKLSDADRLALIKLLEAE